MSGSSIFLDTNIVMINLFLFHLKRIDSFLAEVTIVDINAGIKDSGWSKKIF